MLSVHGVLDFLPLQVDCIPDLYNNVTCSNMLYIQHGIYNSILKCVCVCRVACSNGL